MNIRSISFSAIRWCLILGGVLIALTACSTQAPPVAVRPSPVPGTSTPGTIPSPAATIAPATPSTTTTIASLTVVTETRRLGPIQPLQTDRIIDQPLRNVRALTDGNVKYRLAVWGPNSAWIAAVPQDGPGLDVIHSSTGEVRSIVTDTYVLEPVWQDADHLIVQHTGTDGDTLVRYRLGSGDGALDQIASSDTPIRAVGANGTITSFVAGQGQLVVLGQPPLRLDQPQDALVTAPAPGARVTLAFSPFVDDLEDVQTLLLDHMAGRTTVAPLSAPGEGLWLPRWSPDATKLALTSIGGRIITTTVDGSARYDLGPGDSPAWSPDGSRLAFAGASAGEDYTTRNIHIVDWQGQTARLRVTQADEDQFFLSPSWSPDGSRIAFVELDGGQIMLGDLP